MENQRRKPGRPKASLRTLPLVLDVDRNLEKLEAVIPESTARILGEYTAWVRQCGDMTVEEATTSTIDYALREVFRRDRLWRDRQSKREGKSTQAAPVVVPDRPSFPTALPEPRPRDVGTATLPRPEAAPRVLPTAAKP